MSLATKWRVIWVYQAESPRYPYHLQDQDHASTICGLNNFRPLQFAAEAYLDRADRCPECLLRYEQLVINYTMTKENQ